MAGFPYEKDPESVQKYMTSISVDKENYSIVCDENGRFTGIVFINFKTSKEMKKFSRQEYFYVDRQLNCKIIAKNHKYNDELLNLFRRPRKVFVNYIPKHVNKRALEKILEKFGKIEENTYVPMDKLNYNYSFVIFEKHESAKECVDAQKLFINESSYLRVSYSKPKVSSVLLEKIRSKFLRDYIEGLKSEKTQLCPEEFEKLYQKHYLNLMGN